MPSIFLLLSKALILFLIIYFINLYNYLLALYTLSSYNKIDNFLSIFVILYRYECVFLKGADSMIRKLNSRDASDIEYCLQQKPMFGQFVRIFIKDLGIGIENCNIFGYYEKAKLTCIFSVVLNNLMVYSYADVVPAKEILDFLKITI